MYAMINRGTSIILALLIVTGTIFPIVYSHEDTAIDSFPFLKLLDDVLASILNGDYNSALKLIEIAKNTSILDENLEFIHQRTYKNIEKITLLLNRTFFIEKQGVNLSISELKKVIYETYNDLFSLKTVIKDRINTYVKALGRYAHDQTAFFSYKYDILNKVDLLKEELNSALEDLEETYRAIERELLKGWVNISVDVPEKIYAGDTIVLRLKLNWTIQENHINLSYTNTTITVSIVLSSFYSLSETYTINNNTLEIRIKIPDTQFILNKGIRIEEDERSTYIPTKIILKAQTTTSDSILRGLEVISTKIYVLRPPIDFELLSYSYTNGTAEINALSYLDSPINISVYLDMVSKKNRLLNTTLYPGNNSIRVSMKGITLEHHTLIFFSEPFGKYLAGTWKTTLAFAHKTLEASIDVPRIIVGPPFILGIKGYVETNTSYTVMVEIDGNILRNETSSNRILRLSTDIPFTLNSMFIWFRKVNVTIIPLNESIKKASYTENVLVINTVLLVLMVLFMGIIYMHPAIASFMFWIYSRIKRVMLEEKKEQLPVATYIEKTNKSLNMKHRPFRLRKYYYSVLRLLSKIIGSPRECDTLREYLKRTEKKIPEPVYALLRKIIHYFEKDLYSRHEIDINEFNNLYQTFMRLKRSED